MLGGFVNGPSPELLGILYEDKSLKDLEGKEKSNAESDRQRMLEYGKAHKKSLLKKMLKKD